MKNVGAAFLVTFVAFASSSAGVPPQAAYDVHNIVKQSYYRDVRRPPVSYFAAAERAGAPESEFYRMENRANIYTATTHARNVNTPSDPPGGQHSYLFLAVEGYATGQPGIGSDGREGALAYANLTDASGSKPNTGMAYGFSVYLPSELYSYGDNYPAWVAAQPLYDDRFFKLTSSSLPWVPVLEMSANRRQFTLTYRGGKFDIGAFSSPSSDPNSLSDPSLATTPAPDLCKQPEQKDDIQPLTKPSPYQHTRVAMPDPALGLPVGEGASTANVWHDFIVFYKASSSGADGAIEVWHRTAGAQSWRLWLKTAAPTSTTPVRTNFYQSTANIATGTAAAWGYERPSSCFGIGDIVPFCGSGGGNDCEIADYSPRQADSGLYIDNIVVGSSVSAVRAEFPSSSDPGF